MKRIIALAICLISCAYGLAQTIEGMVVDAKSKEPLPYAMLRLVGSPSGTQTNLDGRYSFNTASHGPTTQITVSCPGYSTDTLTLRALRKSPTIKLKPLEITLSEATVTEFNKPSSLLQEVVRRMPENYWTDTAIGTFFYRRYGLTSDSLWLFCEAMADVMRTGYDKQYKKTGGMIVVRDSTYNDNAIAGNYKRFPLSRLLVYDTAMLCRMLGDSTYAHNPFVGRSQTEYSDLYAFSDMLQRPQSNRWLNGKRSRRLDRAAKLTIYDGDGDERYYLITQVTDRDSTAILINHSDKALLHFYNTSLRVDTLMLPWPLNRVLGGVWSPYSRTQYDYAKINGRYTLVFSMQASAYGVLPPKKSHIVARKINRTIRDMLTDDVVEDYRVWTLVDMRPGGADFIDSTLKVGYPDKTYIHNIFGKGNPGEDFWQQYNTVPLEARIADKLHLAIAKETQGNTHSNASDL